MEALERLHTTVTRAYKVKPRINFEVFIHKVCLKCLEKYKIWSKHGATNSNTMLYFI